jgi:hypothetical protein
MSLLSSFIKNQLIKSLEAEFVAHAPDLQALFVKELESFASEVLTWINEKLIHTNNSTGE